MITLNNNQYPFDGIIFLDIDGVLNGEKWYRSAEHNLIKEKLRIDHKNVNWRTEENKKICAERMAAEISPFHVNILNKILVKFNLGIVVSSAWRGVDFTRNALFLAGIDNYKNRLLGYTPQLKYLEDKASRDSRGLEIIWWMKENKYNGPYVILDDDGDFNTEYNNINLLTRHVQTNCHGENSGLQEFHIKQFEELLK